MIKTKEITLTVYKSDDYGGKTTRVKDLVAALQRVDPEALVYTEGCDCSGNVCSIDISDDSVMLCRS
jgi:hypothetical protein